MSSAKEVMGTTIFEEILAGKVPCKKVYEDEWTLAFHDVSPIAPVHILIIPKKKFVNVNDLVQPSDAQWAGHVLMAARHVAQLMGIEKTGYRLVMNNGSSAGQTVDYMHCHVIGGRDLHWPPG